MREIYSYIANELLVPETAAAQLGRIRKEVRSLDFILYFIQGIYKVMFDKPLYKENCMAWVHGPVYEEVMKLQSLLEK